MGVTIDTSSIAKALQKAMIENQDKGAIAVKAASKYFAEQLEKNTPRSVKEYDGKRTAPRKHPHMQDNIVYSKPTDLLESEVGFNKKVSPRVHLTELGAPGAHQPPQPFIRPTVQATKAEVLNIMAKEMKL